MIGNISQREIWLVSPSEDHTVLPPDSLSEGSERFHMKNNNFLLFSVGGF